MTRFRYEAARPDGAIVRGAIEAPHGAAATVILEERGLLSLSVREAAEHGPRALPKRPCAVFLRGLGSLLEAGIPLDSALGIVRAGVRMEPMLSEVRRRVREGAGLGAALSELGGFPQLALALVRSGEGAGLATTCRRAAEHLEREAELAYRVRAALAYPVMLILLGVGAIGVLVIVVLPRFVALLGDLGTALPFTTRWMVALSHAVTDSWLPITFALGVTATAFSWLVRSQRGHEVVLSVPVVGLTRLQLATVRAARALGTLLDSGAPALAALNAAAAAAGDRAVAERIRRAAERVRTGSGIAAALEREAAFDPQALQLAAAGERSGRLPVLLLHAADLAEGEATRRVDAAVRLIEPALILALGGAVSFVALALLQAVYGLRVG